MLVFFYSGHADERALLLENSELSLAELTSALDTAGAQLSLHIVDACRSGVLTRKKGARLGQPITVSRETQSEGRVVITSSTELEDALESDRLGGSFFTLHMATGLRGAADADEDGRVTLDEAYRYVYGRTVQSTLASGGGVQHPTFSYDLSGQGAVTLTWLERAQGILRFGGGEYAVTDVATGRLVAEVSASKAIGLAPGRYHVVRRTHDALASGPLDLKAGQDVRAESLLVERSTYARLVRKGRADGPGAASVLRAQVGLRGEVGPGLNAAPMLRLGYEVALPWLSIMPFLTGTLPVGFQTPRLRFESQEWGAGLMLSRAADFRWLTLRGGLGAELVHLRQTEVDGREADRTSWGGAITLQAGLESAPWANLFTAALVGEAALYIYSATPGAQEGPSVTESSPTYRLFGALGVHF